MVQRKLNASFVTKLLISKKIIRHQHFPLIKSVRENGSYIARLVMLIGKLSEGDTTALDVVYHKKYYTNLYTKYRSFKRQEETSSPESIDAKSIAFAELIYFIEDFKDVGSTVFKLSELVKMYSDR